MPLLWFGLNSRDAASSTHRHRAQPYLAGHSGAATPLSVYSHPGFLASAQSICGRRWRRGKKGKRNTQNNYKSSQIKRWQVNSVLWEESLLNSDFHQIGVKTNPIPSLPPHYSLRETSKSPSHLLHQITWESSNSNAKGDNNNTCICCLHPKTQTLWEKTHTAAFKSCWRKALPTVASASRMLSTERMKPYPPKAQNYSFHQALGFLHPARQKLL